MTDGFKNFLMADVRKWTPEVKKELLHMLKFNPDDMVARFAENLGDWRTIYMTSCAEVMVCNYSTTDDAREFVEALKQHFAKELEAI